MSSGDARMNFYSKKFFHLNQVKWNFMEYLRELVEDTRKRVFVHAGLFSSVALTADTINSFDIAAPCAGMDAYGHEMTLPTGATLNNNVPFANANGVVYSVGMRWNNNVPSGDSTQVPPQSAIEINARSRTPEYALVSEAVGEVVAPNSVTIITSPSLKLKIVVDSALLCASTPISHAGRLAQVWLVNPVSLVEAVAIYNSVVQWDGSNNYIEIPYSTTQGPLGQTDPEYPISAAVADYLVHIRGVTVVPKSVKDLSADGNYSFVGEVTGSGPGTTPSSFDISGQYILALALGNFTLDTGYDGAVGSGSGRKITVDSGAVELDGPVGGPGDMFRSFLRVCNDDRDWDIGIDLIEKEHLPSLSVDPTGSLASIVTRRKWTGNISGSGEFTQTGTLTLGTGVATVTMPAGSYTRLYPGVCTLRVLGSPGLVDDGVYVVKAVAGTTVTLMRPDSTAPSFNGGSATYHIHIIGSTEGGSWHSVRGGAAVQDWGHAILRNAAFPVARPTLRLMDMAGDASAVAFEIGTPSQAPGAGYFRLYHDGGIAFPGIFNTSLIPGTDNAYDLGETGGSNRRWRNIFAHNAYLYSSIRMDAAARVYGEFIPTSDILQNFGSDTRRWLTLYAKHLDMNEANARVTGHLKPAATDTYDVGEDGGLCWRNILGNYVTAYQELKSSLKASFYGLIWTNTAKVHGHLVPDGDNTYDLGESGVPDNRWRFLQCVQGYFDNVDINGECECDVLKVVTDVVKSSLNPFETGLTLGKAALGVNNWACYLSSITMYGDIKPDVHTTRSIGGPSKNFATAYIDTIYCRLKLYMIGSQVEGSLWPLTDGSYDLGDSSWRWRYLYLKGDPAGSTSFKNALTAKNIAKAWMRCETGSSPTLHDSFNCTLSSSPNTGSAIKIDFGQDFSDFQTWIGVPYASGSLKLLVVDAARSADYGWFQLWKWNGTTWVVCDFSTDVCTFAVVFYGVQ